MSPFPVLAPQKSRLGVLLDHFAAIDDPRDVRRIVHPLAEVLLLVVCATMADCDDHDHIAAWGPPASTSCAHLPCEHGTPGGRWLTVLMNRVNPALFSAALTAWVRETWPARPELVATCGKASRAAPSTGASVGQMLCRAVRREADALRACGASPSPPQTRPKPGLAPNGLPGRSARRPPPLTCHVSSCRSAPFSPSPMNTG